MYDFFLTNTTVEPFNWTTTRGSGLMKELKRTVAGLGEGTLDKAQSLETILSHISRSPTHFMALGVARQLLFDESLLAFFWDRMGGGNSEAYIHHREKLISNRLLIPVSIQQKIMYRISEEVHKHLSKALARRVGGEKQLASVHFLASEYYRRVFEANELPALDALSAFVYHCFACGEHLRAYRYMFESEVISRLQQVGIAIQLQALLETFLEFEAGTALQLQSVLEAFLKSEIKHHLSDLQQSRILIELAHVCSDLGQFERCLKLTKRAEQFLNDSIDPSERIMLLRRIWYYSGVSYSNTGCSDQCIQSYFKIVSTSSELDHLGCLCLGYLAHDLRYRDMTKALKYGEIAVELSRVIEDVRLQAKNLCNLGEIYTFIPQLDKASICFKEAKTWCLKMSPGSTQQRELGRILKNWA